MLGPHEVKYSDEGIFVMFFKHYVFSFYFHYVLYRTLMVLSGTS